MLKIDTERRNIVISRRKLIEDDRITKKTKLLSEMLGYEPATVVDGYGNIFVTAHKENWQLALAPDANSPTATRSMSWVWTSVDGGKTATITAPSKAGTYKFHCNIHSNMHATLTVQ